MCACVFNLGRRKVWREGLGRAERRLSQFSFLFLDPSFPTVGINTYQIHDFLMDSLACAFHDFLRDRGSTTLE